MGHKSPPLGLPWCIKDRGTLKTSLPHMEFWYWNQPQTVNLMKIESAAPRITISSTATNAAQSRASGLRL
jgi:hypothetical protein